MGQGECRRCLGSGKVADSADQEPWTVWRDHKDYWIQRVVAQGLVVPITCPECKGSGIQPIKGGLE